MYPLPYHSQEIKVRKRINKLSLSRNFFQVLLNLKNFLVSNLATSSLKLFTLKEVKYLNMFGPTQF